MTGRVSVGMARLAVCKAGEAEVLATHALGSCVGLTLYDPVAKVGGMLHFMLPAPARGAQLKEGNHMYGAVSIPIMFKQAYALGAQKSRLIVCGAGAAEMIKGRGDAVRIGQRNRTMLRKILWKNGIRLSGEAMGGDKPRTMFMELATGKVVIAQGGAESVLWSNSRAA